MREDNLRAIENKIKELETQFGKGAFVNGVKVYVKDILIDMGCPSPDNTHNLICVAKILNKRGWVKHWETEPRRRRYYIFVPKEYNSTVWEK